MWTPDPNSSNPMARCSYGGDGDVTNSAWSMRAWRAEIGPAIEKFLAARGRALDVGCGNGRHLPWLSEHFERAVGIDPYEKVDDRFVLARTEFLAVSLADYKPTDPFDAVFCIANYYFLHHYNGMTDLVRLLAPKGVIVIFDESRWEPLSYELPATVGQHGLEIVASWLTQSEQYRTTVLRRVSDGH